MALYVIGVVVVIGLAWATVLAWIPFPKEEKLAGSVSIPLEEMPVEQRVAVLIDQLRLPLPANSQASPLDRPDMFRAVGSGDSPATMLLKLGPVAVPQLIEALNDERVTPYGYHLSAGTS